MHEILTIQLGHRANHLATHFWNTQESYFNYSPHEESSPVDHDISFRPGIGPSGEETYTPRTLIYDLKGGFGSLKRNGGLYEDESSLTDDGVWSGRTVIQHSASVQPSAYTSALNDGTTAPPKLTTSTVRYWSDFSRVFYHPRSIVQINDYEIASTILPFDNWDNGVELFSRLDGQGGGDSGEGIMDRDVRRWTEECDHMQGVQIWTGADDAWGGFAARYLEALRDEMGKLGIWLWGIEEKGRGPKDKQLLRMINSAKSTYETSSQASMYIPLSIPSAPLPSYLRLERESQWHTSALLSMALESMMLPSRLRSEQGKRRLLDDMVCPLNVNGNQRIATLQCKVTDSESNGTVLLPTNDDRRVPRSNTSAELCGEDNVQGANARFDVDLSCGGARTTASEAVDDRAKEHIFGRVECLRDQNQPDHKTDSEEEENSRKRRRLAGVPIAERSVPFPNLHGHHDNASILMQSKLIRAAKLTAFARYYSSLQYPLIDSFPSIVSQPPNTLKTVPILTCLSTTSRVSRRVKSLQGVVSMMVSPDEREVLSNGLGEISEAYEEGWSSGSDEDNDD